jgi:hypothetical protein
MRTRLAPATGFLTKKFALKDSKMRRRAAQNNNKHQSKNNDASGLVVALWLPRRDRSRWVRPYDG